MRDSFRTEVTFHQDETGNKGRNGVDPGPGYISGGRNPATGKRDLNSGEKDWRQMVRRMPNARWGA